MRARSKKACSGLARVRAMSMSEMYCSARWWVSSEICNRLARENVSSQNVKIKLRRDPQVPAVIQDCIDQSRTIENGIACFDIAQKIDKRNLISLRARERAHDEVEIGGGKPRPTIRPDHRELVMGKRCAYGKPNRRINCEAFGCVRAFVDVSSQIY